MKHAPLRLAIVFLIAMFGWLGLSEAPASSGPLSFLATMILIGLVGVAIVPRLEGLAAIWLGLLATFGVFVGLFDALGHGLVVVLVVSMSVAGATFGLALVGIVLVREAMSRRE